MDREIRKAKRFNYIALGIVCVLAVTVVGLIISYNTRPLCASVTVQNLKAETSENNGYMLIKADDAYYETGASAGFGGIFAFDEWELVSDKPTGTVTIAIRLAELYVLELYDNGYAAVYDGYASRKTVSYAYYHIPDNIVASLTSYLQENGIPHELGDGTISSATFNH